MKIGILAAGIVVAAAGCAAPGSVAPWRAQEGVVGPRADAPAAWLVVETADGAGTGDEVEHRHPFRLHDAEGRLLESYPNTHAHPVAVAPGRYVVIGRSEAGERRVQVEVQEGRTTIVRHDDLLRGVIPP